MNAGRVALVTLVSTLFARMDQRGVGRPVGVACKRGAHEAEIPTAMGFES